VALLKLSRLMVLQFVVRQGVNNETFSWHGGYV
jgi:hypothetical protein